MNKSKIWLSSPHMGGNEKKYIKEAFDSNWIAPLGNNVNEFERALAQFTGSKYASALSAGTAAIHLALILLDIKPGDEVIVSSFTFSASVNPIVYQGATPILVDSEPDTWNICPKLLEKCIIDRLSKGVRPKAIIVVHLYGMPAKMDEILKVSEEYGIPIIEDAAEALGSNYCGKAVGTFGIMGILSFNGNKIITTSGGGAILSDDKELIERSRFLATQARDDAPHYQHTAIGYNYRISNIVAGIGRGQMEVLDLRISQRRANFVFYNELLKGIKGVSFQQEPDYRFFSNRWLIVINVNPQLTGGITRDNIRMTLEAENIESRPLWKPMHMQPVFADCPFYGDEVSQNLFENGLCLPSGSNLRSIDLQRIVKVLLDIFN